MRGHSYSPGDFLQELREHRLADLPPTQVFLIH